MGLVGCPDKELDSVILWVPSSSGYSVIPFGIGEIHPFPADTQREESWNTMNSVDNKGCIKLKAAELLPSLG